MKINIPKFELEVVQKVRKQVGFPPRPTFDEVDRLLEAVGVGVAVVEDVRAHRDARRQDGLPRAVDVVDRVQHRLHRLKNKKKKTGRVLRGAGWERFSTLTANWRLSKNSLNDSFNPCRFCVNDFRTVGRGEGKQVQKETWYKRCLNEFPFQKLN